MLHALPWRRSNAAVERTSLPRSHPTARPPQGSGWAVVYPPLGEGGAASGDLREQFRNTHLQGRLYGFRIVYPWRRKGGIQIINS